MKYIKVLVLILLIVPAGISYATANLQSTPQSPYGPFIAGQMPIFYYNLLNTGTTDNGTTPPQMNSNWVVVDLYSDNNYPSGKGPNGGWQWISGDGFGPVPAGGSIRVNNGGSGTLRWPDNDYCLPAGNHRVQAFIDNGNDVPETNNNDNNSGWTSFVVNPRTAPAPDLTATRTASTIGPFIAGQTAVLPFVFSNIGTAVPSVLLRARAQIDDFNNGSGFASYTFNNRPVLGIGESRTEAFNWPNAVAGTHSVRVTYVDQVFAVDEINDCNNTSSWVTFTVLPANIEGRLSARTVASGAVVASTTFSVRNIGSITVPSFPYRITVGGVVVASSTYTTPLPISATWTNVTVPITWTAPTVATNQNLPYVLEVVDPTQGLESTTTIITVLAAPPPAPKFISCPITASMTVGSSTNLSARYWASLAPTPSCASTGFTDVTNTTSWVSSAPANATVTNTGTRGVVSALANGSSNVTATYSGLNAVTAVTVATATASITLSVLPETKFVRSGSISNMRISITSNVNLSCTVTGVEGSPQVFAHTAGAAAQVYTQFKTRPMKSSQKVSIRCVNTLNASEFREASTLIEVIPTVKEV